MAFSDQLHQASWRGVPFGVEVNAVQGGRRYARHDYPGRDTIRLEDQGKLPREFRVVGFQVADSAIYGGGDVLGQQKRMLDASEAKGSGTLVHPTLGRITCKLVSYVATQKWDDGPVIEWQFLFVRDGEQLFPAVLSSLSDLVGQAAGLADSAGLGDFVSKLAGPLQHGLDAATAISATAGEWVGKVKGLARDATGLYGTLSQLGGADFGRYFNGRNSGFLAGLVSPYAGASSVTDLISLGSLKREAVVDAGDALASTIGKLGVTASAAHVGAGVQAIVGALQAATADPKDGVRVLRDLAAFAPTGMMAMNPAGQAVTDLFQRSAAAALARVSATYAPSSADDAHAVREAVLAPVQAVISRAGETAADDVFSAFKQVRKAVTTDLGERGGALARLAELKFEAALPSVVIAQQRYQDAAREGELVTQADPIHPWFMPVAFKALAA